MEIETVLVPVDGSDQSVAAVEYATVVAERYDARVHALYVFSEELVQGLETDRVDPAAVSDASEAFMDSVADIAGSVSVRYSGACGFSDQRLSQHPGSVILDCAEDVDADFVIVPREPVTGDPSAVIEKAAEYVLAYASQPVLSV